MSDYKVELEGCSAVIKNIDLIIQSIDKNGKITFVNPKWLKKLGYSKKEAIGMNYFEIVSKENRKHCKEIFKGVLSGKKFTNVETTLVSKNGEKIFIKGNIIPYIEKGKIKHVISACNDITSKKKTEEELSKLASITKYSHELINMSDINGNMIFINKAGSKMLGIKEKDVFNHNIMEVIPKKFINLVQKELLPSLLKGLPWEGKLQYKNLKTGKLIDVHTMAFVIKDDKSGKPIYFANVSHDISEIIENESMLKKAKNRTQQYFDIAGVMISIIDNKGNLIEINHKGLKILGYKKHEVIGKNWFDNFLPKPIKKDVKKVFKKILAGKEKLAEFYENPIIDSKGREKIISWHNTLLKDNDGKIIGALSSGEDITERKKIENKLQNYQLTLENQVKERTKELSESEVRYRSIFEGSNDGILAVNPSTKKFIFANPQMCKLTKYTNKELLSIKVSDLHPKKELHFVLDSLKSQAEGKISLATNIPVLRKDGKVIYCDVNAFPLNIGGSNLLVGSFRDITQQKKIEEKLIESEKKYRELYTTSRDAVMTLEPPTWKFTGGNPATVNMFNTKSEKIFIKLGPGGVSPKYQPDGKLSSKKASEMIKEAMKKGSNFFEWTHKTIDGVEFPATVLLSKLEENGKEFLQATVRDISEQKKAENKILSQIEKLQELDELKRKFLTISSHELKTPLTPAKIQTQMLLQGDLGKLNEKQTTSFEIILRNIDRLDELIGDILEISHIQAGGFKLKLKRENIENLIKSTIMETRPLIKEKNIKLYSKIDKLPKISMDSGRIKEVFSNLLDNAIKFTEKGSITINAKLRKNYILFEVKDTGIGIGKKHFKEIFKPFVQLEPTYTREHGGTGLGLAIIDEIIKKHNGKIDIKSKVGKGTTFFFTLPLKNLEEK
jgi:two-component system, sporulation sensor kinase E